MYAQMVSVPVPTIAMVLLAALPEDSCKKVCGKVRGIKNMRY
jgi:hypothetical protein